MSRLLAAQRALTAPGWIKEELSRKARAIPSLDLRFADSKSLVDAASGANLVTFTRASSGTYVGSDGVLQTAATNEARFDHNPTTGESLGLLVEDQRTNLLLNSATLSTQNVTVTATAHALSFTGTGTITLSGTSTAGPLIGTGAGESNRVRLTFTPTAGTLTLTVSGTVSNAQLEAGAFPTSYIPTTTAAATRSADVASITGANFSSWYRQDEGTIYGESRQLGDVLGFIAAISDGTDNNRIAQFRNSTTLSSRVITAGVAANPGNITISSSQSLVRSAITAASSNGSAAANGTLAAASSPTSLPVADRLQIGLSAVGATQINGTIRRLTYWPQRLSDSTIQALTQ